jgi:DNA-binding NarL/FixJ family response regulator
MPETLPAPYAAELANEPERAAELWTELGCPYEAALALSAADDESAQRRALDQLHLLRAGAAATIVARRLRERGARGLPRGPRPSTRENPAGLTARQLEVLALVAEGLGNAEIAGRLFLSERTVGHHVSAILRKLEVKTRGEASAAARRLHLVSEAR